MTSENDTSTSSHPSAAGPAPRQDGAEPSPSELVPKGPHGRLMPRGHPIDRLAPKKHGARSKIVLAQLLPEKVDELKAFLNEHGSRWMTRADEPLIVQTARNLLIADQIWSYLEQLQAIDTHGRPRGAMNLYLRVQNVLTRQLSALGCSPLARAELGANLAASKLDAAQAMRFSRPRAERAPSPPAAVEGPDEQ